VSSTSGYDAGYDYWNNWMYTFGVTFQMGGKKPAVAPVAAPAPPPPPPAPVKVEAPAPPPPPPTPTCDLTVKPASITSGDSAALTWTSQNATDCTIQPGIGPVRPQGMKTITPAADTAYTLSCTGPGGTATSAANITVVAPLPPPPPPEMLCYTIDIEFDTAKWNIKPQYHDELVKLANFMKDYPGLKGVIEGHTDNRAGYQYNIKLSEKRAKSVRDYIVTKLGIDGARLTTKGYGYTKPIASNKTDEGRQKNRRVIANFACVEKKAKKK
jgi:OOP family OmpA-OmpF porin